MTHDAAFPPASGEDRPRRGYIARQQPRARGAPSLDDVQTLCARCGIYLLCFFDYGVRDVATPIFALALLCAAASLSLRSVRFFAPFWPMWLVTGVYIALSLAQALPSAWTRFYDPALIVRQASWALTLPLLTALGYSYCTQVLKRHAAREFLIIFVLLWANFLVSGFILKDWTYTIWAYGPFGYLWAPFSIFLVAALWAVLLAQSRMATTLFAGIGVLALVLAESSQTKLAYLCALLVIAARGNLGVARLVLIAVLMFLTAGYLWAWIDPASLAAFESNAGVRGLMVRDAFDAAQQSGFLGVGFGTEGVKNAYPEIGMPKLWEYDADFPLIAAHNAFFDILMRMGFVGLAAFLAVLIWFTTPKADDPRVAATRTLLLALVLINLAINVGLQSPFHMAGAAIMFGASYALAQDGQSGPAPRRRHVHYGFPRPPRSADGARS
jgi:hypothetical protein